MHRRSTRLQFTQEELENPAVKKAARKAETAQAKLDKAAAKLPKKPVRRPAVDPKTGRVTTKLLFEEKKPPASKLTHGIRNAPGLAVSGQLHRKISEDEQDNVGVRAAHKTEMLTEGGVRTADSAFHSAKLRPYRKADRAEARADKANLAALNKYARQQNPQLSGNPVSRWQQRQAIKREYAAAKRADSVRASEVTKNAAKAADKARQKVGSFVVRHRKGAVVLAALALMVVFLSNTMSSCSVLTQSLISATGISTYPSEDADMRAAEEQYCGLEAELQALLDNYEETHSYNEYHFDLDDIEHDPYVLISALTALREGAWTISEVQSTLQTLFDRQYILTETVTVETRTRGEETYDYTVCRVKLENCDLSHLPVFLMTEEQLSMYSVYMATLGNRADLWPDSAYVGKYVTGGYTDYEIPTEALADEQFAAIVREAEKYLGYPYVWGGSSPSTSFDCSGFVSWVVNHAGWSVGRQSAQGLCNLCTKTSTPHPGDLVFFVGTYDTPGVSHVGIYVGEHMMIHCGDPISYSNLNSNYWKQHFYCYGKLP